MRNPEAVAARHALLTLSHVALLAAYVAELRLRYASGWEFPDFDPLDGGIEADMLFLLEKPGPMTSPKHRRIGSGFVSRDNNDPTAEATSRFMRDAGIDRRRTVLWNTIPGWNKTIEIGRGGRARGIAELPGLLKLLPRVRTVVLVGKQAHRAEPELASIGMRVFKSAHPSTRVRNSLPELWYRIPVQWSEAAAQPVL
ncbi:uracil-DNA glycosylase [Burkholderia sp. R-70211]|nr:uracil-DNA glycosylase [Burkholderia sp. R-70211]